MNLLHPAYGTQPVSSYRMIGSLCLSGLNTPLCAVCRTVPMLPDRTHYLVQRAEQCQWWQTSVFSQVPWSNQVFFTVLHGSFNTCTVLSFVFFWYGLFNSCFSLWHVWVLSVMAFGKVKPISKGIKGISKVIKIPWKASYLKTNNTA